MEGVTRLRNAGAVVGDGARAWLGEDFEIGRGVVIGEGVTLVAKTGRIEAGVHIGPGCNVRASALNLGRDSEIQAGTSILVADGFFVGAASRIERDVAITCREFSAGDLFYFGHGSSVGYGGTMASTAIVRIGSRVALGPNSILNANWPISLGDQVGSGCNLSIWTHGYHFGHRLLDGYDAAFAEVHVAENVWLGFHVTVLPGVSIGANTIVAAGAVVAQPLPADVIAAGVPAKPKKALAPQAVTGAAADQRIVSLLDEWVTELEWKGIAAERPSAETVVLQDHRVVMLADRGPLPRRGEHALILLTVEDRPDLRDAEGCVLFELRSGALHGALEPISHDLRDFLRRNALPCGDHHTFRSLLPQAFERLLHPDRHDDFVSTAGAGDDGSDEPLS